MKLHLTYFGDENFSIGKSRIRKQAENFEVFDSILEFGESDLENNWAVVAEAIQQHRAPDEGHAASAR